MRSLLAAVAAATLAGFACASAQAQSDGVNQLSMGFGAVTCGRFLDMIDNPDVGETERAVSEELFTSWIEGYVTALNIVSDASRPLNVLSRDEIDAVVREYCEANRQAFLADASVALFERLGELNAGGR